MTRATDSPAIDLLVATVDRTQELVPLLDSLAAQSYHRFRLVVVDQNVDDRLDPVLTPYRDRLRLVRVRATRGLSRARNVGLRQVDGDIVGFPDDDCSYPPDFLERVVDALARNPRWGGLTGRTVDSAGRGSFLLWQRTPGTVERQNVWRTAVAVTIFLRRSVVDSVGGFDESLGAGAGTPWESGEETDYVLRALDAGHTLGFEPSLAVFHESPDPEFGRAAARKGYGIGMGNSRVLRQHGYSWWFAAYRVLQVTAGAGAMLMLGRAGSARFYWAMARGRVAGWLRGR